MPQGGNGSSRLPGAVRAARWVLFALLLASAGFAVFGLPALQGEVAAGRWPRAVLAIPPVLLAGFVVGYAGYRLVLVRQGRYPAGKALVQVGVMALVLAIVVRAALVPSEMASAPAVRPARLGRLLASPDVEVRALAAEVARHRSREEALAHVGSLSDLLDDPSPLVRLEAHETLVALAGRDVGGEGPGAAARWRDHWRREGALPR